MATKATKKLTNAGTRSRATGSRPKRGRAGAKSGARRPARRGSGAPAVSRVRAAARAQLGDHGTDALALGVLVMGLLAGLALATELTGPVGDALGDGLTALFGNGAFLVPLSLVAVAVLLLWRRTEDAAEAAPLRVGIGAGLVVFAAAGLMHVLGGAPALSGAVDPLRDAGGYLGALVGAPLGAGLGTVGAAVVLIALLGFGLLLAPGTSIRRVVGLIGAGITHARNYAVEMWELHGPDDTESEDEAVARRPLPSRRTTVESIADDPELDLSAEADNDDLE